MTRQVLLVCSPKDHPNTPFLFEKVIGIPLLLRNLLALGKAGYQNIGVILPAFLAERYHDEIAPELEKRGLNIVLSTYENEFPRDKISAPLVLPAHCLFEEKLPAPHFRLLIDSPQKIKEAEKCLLETIRLSTPGPIARYLNKRISLPISLRLARRRLHPNWITSTNMIIGFSTGFFIAHGTYPSFVLGGFLFQMASIFDGCDGEVAKLNFKTNKFGEYFDSLSDNGALVSFFVGLILAFAKDHTASVTLGVAALLLGGLGGLLWQVIQFLKKHTQSASLITFDKEYLSKLSAKDGSPLLLRFIRHGKILMRKDCFSFAFFIAALVGILPWCLYIAIGGIWIANGILLFLKQQPIAVPKTTRTYE